jgi:hypothetical protein
MRAVLAVVAATCIAACGFSAPTAHAGAYGQQIELYAPIQHSVRVCGINQTNQSVCHVWKTLGYRRRYRRHYYKLASWWWIGTVAIENFADSEAQQPLDVTLCEVPRRQRSNWTHCNGFGYPSSYTGLSNSPGFALFGTGPSGSRDAGSDPLGGAAELLAPGFIFTFAAVAFQIGLAFRSGKDDRKARRVSFCWYVAAGGLVALGVALSTSAAVAVALGAVVASGRWVLIRRRLKSKRRQHRLDA